MISILSKGAVTGVLLAAASTPTNIEDQYISIGRVVCIVGAVAIGAWTVRSKFDQVANFMAETKRDRTDIHDKLEKYQVEMKHDREMVAKQLEISTLETKLERQKMDLAIGGLVSSVENLPCVIPKCKKKENKP